MFQCLQFSAGEDFPCLAIRPLQTSAQLNRTWTPQKAAALFFQASCFALIYDSFNLKKKIYFSPVLRPTWLCLQGILRLNELLGMDKVSELQAGALYITVRGTKRLGNMM